MVELVLMGAGLLLFGAGALLRARKNKTQDKMGFRPSGGLIKNGELQAVARGVPCVVSHSEEGLNYPWLRDVHGGLVFIEYEEPPGSGVWRRYTPQTWEAHCRVISHNPATLVAEHVKAFINPQTRFARLRFTFRNGTVMDPIPGFYEREAAWIRQYGQY